MVLDILILSALRAGAMHGYELKRRVQRPSFVALSNNSLYPTLHRFERAGAVTHTVEEQEGKPARKVYEITEGGRALFVDMISVLPVTLAGNDEEFLVRLGLFDHIRPDNRHEILAARTAALNGKTAQIIALIEGRNESTSNGWPTLAMTHLLAVVEQERQWIAGLAERVALEQPRDD